MTTLLFERGAGEDAGRERATIFFEQMKRLVALAKRNPRRGSASAADDPVLRDRLATLYVEAQAEALGAMRSGVPGLVAERPFALRFSTKLVMSEWNQRLAELACDLLGPDVVYWLGDPEGRESAEVAARIPELLRSHHRRRHE